MGSEPTNTQGKIDLRKIQEMREKAKSKRELEDRTRENNFIESERARVGALISNLPQKLEEAARKGYVGCDLLMIGIFNGPPRISKEELRQHNIYGELIRYLETQGLTDVGTRFHSLYNSTSGPGEEPNDQGEVYIYVTLP